MPASEPSSASSTHESGSRKKALAKAPVPKTLGPVPDLERHLPPDWWRTLFNSVYLKTDGDVVENKVNTQKEIDLLIRAAGLKPTDRVLDLCCGQGRHCLELASRGFRNVVGVDRSRYLIRLARRRAKETHLDVAFHEGDARKFRLKVMNFNCVAMLGNSFGYFDREEDDVGVLQAVTRALVPGGTLALDLTNGQWIRENYEPRSWEWIDKHHLVCRERSLSSDQARLISREVVVHDERGVIVDQFYAERLYSRERITEMLEETGFTSVKFHEQIEADSTRGQDLGMMQNRMFLTGQAPRSSKSVQVPSTLFPRITVLLGDHRLPDTCKRGGKFNKEDFETVDRLKAALKELKDVSFSYMDNHAELIDTLRKKRPEFIFNLCDEGYENDAFKELHVPAILEMLGIPYSGAGPTTLGMCYNKSIVRSLAATLDVPVPLETYFDQDDQSATLPSVLPALVKPNYGDSSIGITQRSVVHTSNELMARLEEIQQELPGKPILIQELLTGPEYTVGIIGNPGQGFHFLPLLEVDYTKLDPSLPRILGYESKWLPDSPYWTQISYKEAELDEDTVRRLYDHSGRLFERLGCRDYARFDFRADSHGRIKLLEVNPNPGWCWDGKLNLMAEMAGYSYADLLRLILEAASNRVAMQGSR